MTPLLASYDWRLAFDQDDSGLLERQQTLIRVMEKGPRGMPLTSMCLASFCGISLPTCHSLAYTRKTQHGDKAAFRPGTMAVSSPLQRPSRKTNLHAWAHPYGCLSQHAAPRRSSTAQHGWQRAILVAKRRDIHPAL